MAVNYFTILVLVLVMILGACATAPDKSEPLISETMEKTEDSGSSAKISENNSENTSESTVEEIEQKRFLPTATRILLGNGLLDMQILFSYDDLGRLVREESFLSDGKVDGWEELVYEGSLLREVNTFSADGELLTLHRYEHDDLGRITRDSLVNNSDFVLAVSEYEYASGAKSKWVLSTGTGILLGYVVYSYEDGISERAENYAPDGIAEGYTLKEFQNGRKMREAVYSADGTLVNEGRYTYEGGMLVKRSTVNRGKESGSVSFVYDADNNLVRETRLDVTGNPVEILEYEYRLFQ